jgi:hypothetical protein
MKKIITLSMVVSSLLLADTELEILKKQMNEQQAMIQKLLTKIEKMEQNSFEGKLKNYQQNAQTTQETKSHTHLHDSLPTKTAKDSTLGSYMPNISLIADISYVGRSINDDQLVGLETPGVAHGLLGSHNHDGNSHAPYNAKKGFNLNYAELGLSKSVDQNFKLNSIFHFSENSVEIEELYFTTGILGHGFNLKGGKFNSDFGYHNNKHHHAWSFADNALVYEAFLGMHGINEKGAQLQWTAPTDTYFMVGAEILQGENEQMFGNNAMHLSENDLNTTLPDLDSTDAPSLIVAYAKTSVDVGDTTILGGVSYAKGETRLNHITDEDEPHAFSGKSELYGVDLVVKHFFDSYSSLTWQSEYLQRKMEGTKYEIDTTTNVASSGVLNKKQAGLYTQLIYALNQNWKFGLRYDTIFKNNINGTEQQESFNKYSAVAEYNTSHFTKLRLQYNQDKSQYDASGRRDISSVILQANFAIGAHGAHGF